MSEEQESVPAAGGIADRIAKIFDPFLETHSTANVVIMVGCILAAIPIVGVGLYATVPIAPHQNVAQTSRASRIQALFTCEGGKSIDASFLDGFVALTLSDGRQLQLPQARSADGARYANADESVVFWNVGNTATLSENGRETYSGCITNS